MLLRHHQVTVHHFSVNLGDGVSLNNRNPRVACLPFAVVEFDLYDLELLSPLTVLLHLFPLLSIG